MYHLGQCRTELQILLREMSQVLTAYPCLLLSSFERTTRCHISAITVIRTIFSQDAHGEIRPLIHEQASF